MRMQFDKNGNLEGDKEISLDELRSSFGYNEKRELLVNNFIGTAERFKKIGCETIYIFGSFTTSKEEPNDIDICADISDVDEKAFSHFDLADMYELARVKKYLSVHILYKLYDDRIFTFLKRDREGNTRGIIKISLKEMTGYDKE